MTIPGTISAIYNYCDRWCERCRFQQRCDVFHDVKAMEAGTYAPPEISAPAIWGNYVDLNVELTPAEELQAEIDHQLRSPQTGRRDDS